MIELDPELINAARNGDLTAVQNMINSWTDDDRRYGWTKYSPVMAVLQALAAGHDDVVNWLLDNGHVEAGAFSRLYPHTTVKLTDAQKAVLVARGFKV